MTGATEKRFGVVCVTMQESWQAKVTLNMKRRGGTAAKTAVLG